VLTRRQNTKARTDGTGDKPSFDPTPRRVLWRSRSAHHLLAGLDRGADWLRSGPARWVGRVAHLDSPLVNRAILALAARAEWRRPAIVKP
jgi:hypothetical protein